MTSSVPAVSVIVPAYRTEDTIVETLDSIFAQTFTDFEVVVVSNEVYDRAEQLERILQPYSARIIHAKQKIPGLANARNVALDHCRAPLIALLDSDDVWEPDYLTVQVGMMQADPTIDVLYPNAVFFGETRDQGDTFMQWFPSKGPVTVVSLLNKQCSVFISVTARLDTVIRAGRFDGSLVGAEDLDLWLRIAKMGGKFAYHDKILVRFRSRPNSLSCDPVGMCQHLLALLEKTRHTMNLEPDERACLEKSLAEQTANLSLWRGKRALYQSDFEQAHRYLSESNKYLGKPKLYLLLLLIRTAPSILHKWIVQRYPSEHAFMHS